MPINHVPITESGWRKTIFEVIFQSETSAGKAFDVTLIWAIVISVAAVVMVIGYGIIAVPTGIVTVEFSHAAKKRIEQRSCPVYKDPGWHQKNVKRCNF